MPTPSIKETISAHDEGEDLPRMGAAIAPERAVAAGLTRDAIQKKALEYGFEYWRASDSHGVEGTKPQAVELLQDLLGVEVEIKDNGCATCDGVGMIGGPSFYNPGEGGEECPDCALTAPVATEQAQAVGACVFLDFKQATDVLAMFGGEPGEVQLQFGDGHGGRGLYASYAEYPEEGAEYLGMSDGEALPSPEAAPAAMEGDPAEAAEILKSLIDNIERGGMYSQESTLGFLSQAYYCLKPANPAATPAAPSIGTASMYAQQHGLAVTTEWMIGWNACLDAIDAAALAQPAQEATLPAWWERFMHELTLQAEDEVRADLPGVLETCALDAIAALAAPVQQDAPAPSMVGDAKGGA